MIDILLAEGQNLGARMNFDPPLPSLRRGKQFLNRAEAAQCLQGCGRDPDNASFCEANRRVACAERMVSAFPARYLS